MTDAQRRRKANAPTEAQRASIATGVRLEAPRPPGVMDGQVRPLVTNGVPDCPEGAALMRWYNAHPPQESERPIAYMGTAVREQRARRNA